MNTPTVKDFLTVQPSVRLHDKLYEFADELAAALAIIDDERGRAHHMEALVLNHEQQIKDIAAHLLELKQSITPTMEFKRREWAGLTDDEMQTAYRKIDDWNACLAFIDSKLREKNGG
jgi:hypothetical protein